jgi:CheY-like chemotaxis protein
MAEGVAHHFGQILNVVETQAGNQPGQEPNPQAAQVIAETRRGAALVRQLLAVGACEAIQPESVDINAFLREKDVLLRRLIGERISLEFHLVEGLAPARVDLRALEHIILNLVLNARDALPQGGAIDIHTEAVWLEAKSSGTNAQQALPGPYIHLTVGDNGCGMSAEVQEHLFEPFFTTRDNAKAMGLGLATIYGATKQHGGWVECETHPQRGTHMSVFLPVAQPDLSPEAAPEAPAAPVLRETIMLVESNDRVRDLARHILQRDGYRVVEADSPATASLLLDAQAKEISLLLTDLNFPSGQSGRDLADSLRVLNPQVKIVFASGPLSPDDTEPGILQEGKLLLKPYTPDRLLHAVSSGLSASALCPV